VGPSLVGRASRSPRVASDPSVQQVADFAESRHSYIFRGAENA